MFWKPWGEMMRAKAGADHGGGEACVEALQKALAAYEADGVTMGKSLFLAMLAEAQSACGDHRGGLHSIAAARQFVAQSGEVAFVPELHRLEGELLLGADPKAQARAETCFNSALEQARCQNAKAWELRAATSLARLWLQQGRRAQSRALLAPLYAWFSEGHTGGDLLAARTLLEQIAG
ncbi:MAG: hypothetical protein IPG43_16295 [Proteobacteria bacterium]|nr:hypothetical protein [Pseudomonadota bacterium]